MKKETRLDKCAEESANINDSIAEIWYNMEMIYEFYPVPKKLVDLFGVLENTNNMILAELEEEVHRKE